MGLAGTALTLGKRKADVLGEIKRKKLRNAKPDASETVPADFIEDFATRLQVTMLQTQTRDCVTAARKCVARKLNAANPLLMHMLEGGNVEHWCRVFDSTTRELLSWYANVPDVDDHSWWVCAGTVAVRLLLVEGVPAHTFLKHLKGLSPEQYTEDNFDRCLGVALQLRPPRYRGGAYYPFGRGVSIKLCKGKVAAVRKRLYTFLGDRPAIKYDPVFWMGVAGLKINRSADTQFCIMQLAMDWYYSPVTTQRDMAYKCRKLYYVRGPGVRKDVSVEAAAERVFRHATIRRCLGKLGFKLEKYFTTEHALCGSRKWLGQKKRMEKTRGNTIPKASWEKLEERYLGKNALSKKKSYAETLAYLRRVCPLS